MILLEFFSKTKSRFSQSSLQLNAQLVQTPLNFIIASI